MRNAPLIVPGIPDRTLDLRLFESANLATVISSAPAPAEIVFLVMETSLKALRN